MPIIVKPFRIGLDLDGVIIDHTSNKIYLAQLMGLNLNPVDTPSHRLVKIFTPERYQKIQRYIYGPGTMKAPMMKDAKFCLRKLKQDHQLFLISCRSAQFQSTARKWLAKNLGDIFNRQNIYFVKTEEEKNSICQKLSIQVFLDDKFSVLEKLETVSQLYLFDQYRLASDFELRNIQPISSWSEFVEAVNKWSEVLDNIKGLELAVQPRLI